MTQANPLKIAYAHRFPGEVATYLAKQGGAAITQSLDGLPDEVAAGLVARLPHGHAMRLLASQEDQQIVVWLDAAALDHALAILLHIDADRRTRILDALPSRRARRTLRRLVLYPRETIGATVNAAAMRLDADMALGEAIELLRSDEPATEPTIWLIDDQGNYQGLLDLGRALAARSDRSRLSEFLVRVKPIRAETTLASARGYREWLEHPELPVIDEAGHLLGSITHSRLAAELADGRTSEPGLADGVSELTRQYFRIMGVCLGDLFGTPGTRRGTRL